MNLGPERRKRVHRHRSGLIVNVRGDLSNRHEYDYVVVPLTSGALNIVDKDGTESTAQLAAGVEHNVINASGGAFAFVEIEFK